MGNEPDRLRLLDTKLARHQEQYRYSFRGSKAARRTSLAKLPSTLGYPKFAVGYNITSPYAEPSVAFQAQWRRVTDSLGVSMGANVQVQADHLPPSHNGGTSREADMPPGAVRKYVSLGPHPWRSQVISCECRSNSASRIRCTVVVY